MSLMKILSRFGVVILALLIELIFNSLSPAQAIHFSQKTIHYNLKPSDNGNLCFYLGKLKGTLDLTLEQGSSCVRFRISSTHLRRQYLKVTPNSSLDSQLDLTLSSPRFGGIYERKNAGLTAYSNCSSPGNAYKSIHLVKSENNHRRTSLGFLYLTLFLVLIFLSLNYFLFSQIQKLENWNSAQFLELSQLQSQLTSKPDKRYVKVTGIIECKRPLTSPLTHKLCVEYRFWVEREYKKSYSKSKSISRETVFKQQQQVPFTLQQGEKKVTVISNEAEITKKDYYSESRNKPPLSSSSSKLGTTLGYRYCESILPVGASVTIVGLAKLGGIVKPQKYNESLEHPQFLITKPQKENGNWKNKRFLITTQTEVEFSDSIRSLIIGLTILMLFFGIFGFKQAIFTIKLWQLSEAEFCRLRVQSWE